MYACHCSSEKHHASLRAHTACIYGAAVWKKEGQKHARNRAYKDTMKRALTVHVRNEDLGDLADAQPLLPGAVWLLLELAHGPLGAVDHCGEQRSQVSIRMTPFISLRRILERRKWAGGQVGYIRTPELSAPAEGVDDEAGAVARLRRASTRGRPKEVY